MPSIVRPFWFRSSQLRQKLDALNIDGDRFAKVLLQHAEQALDDGVCPVCQKPFGECEYFRELNEE